MPITYKSIVFCQSATGSWGEGLLEVIGATSLNEIMDKNESVKGMEADVVLTLMGLKLLNKYFSHKVAEWGLVAKKGEMYIKKKGLMAVDLLA